MNRHRHQFSSALLCVAVLTSGTATAHEGEADEGEATAPPVPAAAAVVSRSDGALSIEQPPFELVIHPQQDGWVVFADDYASNQPLSRLQLRLAAASHVLRGAEAAPGEYHFISEPGGPHPAGPAHLSVIGGETPLEADVVLPGVDRPAVDPHAAVSATSPWPWAGAALALLAIALGAQRRRRRG